MHALENKIKRVACTMGMRALGAISAKNVRKETNNFQGCRVAKRKEEEAEEKVLVLGASGGRLPMRECSRQAAEMLEVVLRGQQGQQVKRVSSSIAHLSAQSACIYLLSLSPHQRGLFCDFPIYSSAAAVCPERNFITQTIAFFVIYRWKKSAVPSRAAPTSRARWTPSTSTTRSESSPGTSS
jgi:hypothetical protein